MFQCLKISKPLQVEQSHEYLTFLVILEVVSVSGTNTTSGCEEFPLLGEDALRQVAIVHEVIRNK
jgi:hypothetical protein